MTKNMGTTDRVVRAAVAVVAVGVALSVDGAAAVALLVLAAVLAATSAAGFCPLYVPFGITTRRGSRLA